MPVEFPHVQPGAEFQSRTGRLYTIGEVTARRFEVIRDGGKPCLVSWKLVNSTLDRLQSGEVLTYQANGRQGGISYTVAVESGVLFALKDLAICDNTTRTISRKG